LFGGVVDQPQTVDVHLEARREKDPAMRVIDAQGNRHSEHIAGRYGVAGELRRRVRGIRVKQ
ncbi:hypothetical protein, partial [Micromonospora rubida]